MKTLWQQPCMLSPSLICLDHCRLGEQVHILETGGIQMLHVDILDGHFSPSMPLGLDTVRQLRAATDLAFDCHVMTTANAYFIEELLDIGVQQIVFHAETEPHIDGMLNRIQARGVRAGVALKPATPLSVLDCVLEKCDHILLMLINPGYAFSRQEEQVAYADRKICQLRALIETRGASATIGLDGRISAEQIRRYGAGLADVLVVGSTCLNPACLAHDVAVLQQLRSDIVEEMAGRLNGR